MRSMTADCARHSATSGSKPATSNHIGYAYVRMRSRGVREPLEAVSPSHQSQSQCQ
jgi:hypothetical protein